VKTVNFIFGCHSHQPVGNFDFVFDEAYEKSYRPFLDVLERFPAVHTTLHYTGPLLDYFAAKHPEYIERLTGMVQRGQVEIMGGGYYEPLVCAIPERDAIAQITHMQRFCKEHFGVKPRGMWVTERVWEPQMAATLAKAGVEYTVLDDTHFLCSGLTRSELFGYYVTEHEGHSLKVFPMQERLRYLVPFHLVEETIDYLRANASEDGMVCAVLHDDGEKFGVWPGTYHSVYEEGWLERFFQTLTDNRDWLRSVTYSEYLAQATPKGRTYLTCASYEEMMTWALPTPIQRRLLALQNEVKADPAAEDRFGVFLRGSFWRGFLAKYSESNNIQKRMYRVSERLATLRKEHQDDPTHARLLDEAESLLHQGQCNCAYWHGVFGGLYLNHLRTALYQKLIAADKILDGVAGRNGKWVHCEQVDFDADGNMDAVLENSKLALFLNASDGGTLFELDYKPKPFNFMNTLTRREEPYHDHLRAGAALVGGAEDGGHSIHELVQAKEGGLENLLCYDPYRRVSLRDVLLPARLPIEAVSKHAFDDPGGFATAPYRLENGKDWVRLSCERKIGPEQVLALTKTLRLAPDASLVEIEYDMEYRGDAAKTLLFGIEFAANLLTGSASDRYYRSDDRDLQRTMLGTPGLDTALPHIALRDDWQQLELGLRFSEAADVYRFGIDTVSQSEAGQERVYQGSVVIPVWEITLTPGMHTQRRIKLEIIEVHSA